MLINDPESLKSWLVVVLEPLCDADSSALARYVLALLKKDKPLKELKKVMIEQLDVFLSADTKPFVDKLFTAISSDEYLKPTPIIVKGSNIEVTEPVIEISKEIENPSSFETRMTDISYPSVYKQHEHFVTLDEDKTKDITQKTTFASMNSFKENATNMTQHPQSGATQLCVNTQTVKATADKENQPRDSRRRRASFRSRSRSNERTTRRSRSRDRRQPDREKIQRQFRNKSPPTIDVRHIASNERRRTGVGGSDRRRIVGNTLATLDDRSPRFIGMGGEGRKARINHSNSRSRSASLERIVRSKCSPCSSRPTRSSPDRHHLTPAENENRQRCRDFDEKGYCVRGETCPWDHGVNPVVFEGINNSALISMSLREYNPDAPDLWSRSATATDNPTGIGSSVGIAASVTPAGINPFTGSARTGTVMVGVSSGTVGFPLVAAAGDKRANATAILTNEFPRAAAASFRGAASMMPFPFNPAAVATPLQRELIPIPVIDAGTAGGDVSIIQHNKRRFELEDSVAIAEGPTKRKISLNNRLGPRNSNMQINCSLELRKIPRGLNTIAHLNNHFAKFGKIVNIQVSYDGDQEAAIVTFSTHAEANVAYRSTEAVLNNRFIKVFWHNQDIASAGLSQTFIKDDNILVSMGSANWKNNQYHVNNVPALPTPSFDSAKVSNATSVGQITATSACVNNPISATTVTGPTTTSSDILSVNPVTVVASHVPIPSLRLKNSVQRGVPNATNAIIRKKQEEQAKAVVQLANGLRKRKQELLQSYVKQMKSALELVERCEPNEPQRSKTFATIKVLQETIDKLRKEIATEQEHIQAHIQNQPTAKKTKEQQKKELLDIELELFAQQQEGNDTTFIQKRLEELQRSLGIIPGSGNICSNNALIAGNKLHFIGRTNTRGRPSFPEISTRVDRRPKTVVVTGFTKDEADFVLGHFKHFGEITKHDVDREIPQLILSYATRLSAEQAILRGKLFKDKRLQISWAPTISTSFTSTNHPEPVSQKICKPEETPAVNASDIDGSDTLPELRLEDEEEEDESEDRSWRR